MAIDPKLVAYATVVVFIYASIEGLHSDRRWSGGARAFAAIAVFALWFILMRVTSGPRIDRAVLGVQCIGVKVEQDDYTLFGTVLPRDVRMLIV